MAKRKVLDKAKAREKRDHMLAAAARAELSLTDWVREMREIAGMTQEEFARHRGVSARAVKALELGQGNPTVALLNRIGDFFGLEVAFVPKKQAPFSEEQAELAFSPSDEQVAKVLRPMQTDAEFLNEITKNAWSQTTRSLEAQMQEMMIMLDEQAQRFHLVTQQLDKTALSLEHMKRIGARFDNLNLLDDETKSFESSAPKKKKAAK